MLSPFFFLAVIATIVACGSQIFLMRTAHHEVDRREHQVTYRLAAFIMGGLAGVLATCELWPSLLDIVAVKLASVRIATVGLNAILATILAAPAVEHWKRARLRATRR